MLTASPERMEQTRAEINSYCVEEHNWGGGQEPIEHEDLDPYSMISGHV